MMLLICICALTDTRNGPPPPGLVPITIFVLILMIGISLGWQTGYAINPARDFGPRLFSAMIYSRKVFSFRQYAFFVVIYCNVS